MKVSACVAVAVGVAVAAGVRLWLWLWSCVGAWGRVCVRVRMRVWAAWGVQRRWEQLDEQVTDYEAMCASGRRRVFCAGVGLCVIHSGGGYAIVRSCCLPDVESLVVSRRGAGAGVGSLVTSAAITSFNQSF